MVRGAVFTVTAAPATYQRAETHRITFGLGIARPTAAQPSVYGLRASAFMGFPCPKNTAGIRTIAGTHQIWNFSYCMAELAFVAVASRGCNFTEIFRLWCGATSTTSP